MTAYIRVSAAALAASVGTICGIYAHHVNNNLHASVVKAGLRIADDIYVSRDPYGSRVGCTASWTGHDVVVFSDTNCPNIPGFATTPGYAPPTGDPRFGVVCALSMGDAFNIIASSGTSNSAGLLCDGIRNKGWDENPAMGDDFNNLLQETSRAVRT